MCRPGNSCFPGKAGISPFLEQAVRHTYHSLMDVQGARNLTALDRALQTVAEALLHIGDCEDCLNREVILPASDSDAAEQMLEAARTNLLRLQTLLHQHHHTADERLRTAQVAYLLERPRREHSDTDYSINESMGVDQLNSHTPSCDTQKGDPEDGHSYAGTIVRGGFGGNHDD